MVTEILICDGIALIIILVLVILTAFMVWFALWLDEIADLDFEAVAGFVTIFIGLTLIVWVIRTAINETDKAQSQNGEEYNIERMLNE